MYKKVGSGKQKHLATIRHKMWSSIVMCDFEMLHLPSPSADMQVTPGKPFSARLTTQN